MSKELATGYWAPPGTGDVRSPCPGIILLRLPDSFTQSNSHTALNTLANHGHLHRNGQMITVDEITNALVQVYNLDQTFARSIAVQGTDPVIGEDGVIGLNELADHHR
jgi:hypothetical protein